MGILKKPKTSPSDEDAGQPLLSPTDYDLERHAFASHPSQSSPFSSSGPAPPAYEPVAGGRYSDDDLDAARPSAVARPPHWQGGVAETGPPAVPPYSEKQTRRRFLRALVWALGIWLVCHITVLLSCQWTLCRPSRGGGHHSPPWTPPILPPGEQPVSAPTPPSSDGAPASWAVWGPTTVYSPNSHPVLYHSFANFTLSPDASLLFAHAFGSAYGGEVAFDFVDADEHGDGGDGQIHVDVEAIFADEQSRNEVAVVKMSKEGSEGLGIYGNDQGHNETESRLSFQATIRFPSSSATKAERTADGRRRPLHIKHFETDVWNMAVSSSKTLEGNVEFGVFDAKTKNGPVAVDSIVATDKISVESLNGPLRSSRLLSAPIIEAQTSNGAVTFENVRAPTSVTLSSQNGRVWSEDVVSPNITCLSRTGNVRGTYHVTDSLTLNAFAGNIEADVYVEEDDDAERENGKRPVTVKATTRTGSVNLVYKGHAPLVPLFSAASSETGKVRVIQHPAFEGDFRASAFTGSVDVVSPPLDVKDPAGLGRKRSFVKSVERGVLRRLVKGRQVWADPSSSSDDDGRARLGNSVAEATTGSVFFKFL